jgi:hypothetical protein
LIFRVRADKFSMQGQAPQRLSSAVKAISPIQINQEDIEMINVELNDALFAEQSSKCACSEVNSELESQSSLHGDGDDENYSTYVMSMASTAQSWRKKNPKCECSLISEKCPAARATRVDIFDAASNGDTKTLAWYFGNFDPNEVGV